MKQILSTLLAACMCFSVGLVLTACGHEHTYQTEWFKDASHHWYLCEGEGCTETSGKAEHTWNDGEITTPATVQEDGVKTFACTVCGQTKTESIQLTTTVTKEEWLSNFTIDNYTVHALEYEGESSYETVVKGTVSALYQVIQGEEQYMVLKDGTWYWVTKKHDNYTATTQEIYKNSRLGDLYFLTSESASLENIYNNMLTYDESEKCYYVAVSELEDVTKMEFVFNELCFYFENGTLTKVIAKDTEKENHWQTHTISDIGTTTIDIPDFTIRE